jgi:hypothetical protein
MWSDVSAIEFTEDSPVGYVKKLLVEGEVPVGRLSETCHRNIVNLREVFITERSIFFVYEKWGISLEEIHHLSPVFQLGEVEVATICREVRLAPFRKISGELIQCLIRRSSRVCNICTSFSGSPMVTCRSATSISWKTAA